MTLTRADIRQKLIDLFNRNENIFGYDLFPIIQDFIEREKICPSVVAEIVNAMGDEGVELSGGRKMISTLNTYPIEFTGQFYDELWACKHLHTGGIRCPKS